MFILIKLNSVLSTILIVCIGGLPLVLAIKPKLLDFSNDNIKLIENITYPLSCILISGSRPLMFEWFQNGNKLVNKSNLKLDNQDQMSTLTFLSVKVTNSGQYECRARNQFGTDSIMTRIFVTGLKYFPNLIICSSFQNEAL